MPTPEHAPTVFYARDKSPFGESEKLAFTFFLLGVYANLRTNNSLRESIEDDEPLVNIVSDLMAEDEKNSDDSVSPPLEDGKENIAPAKASFSSEDYVPKEVPKRKAGRPAKRQRRVEPDGDAVLRRSPRLSSVASSANQEIPEPVNTPTKRGRGRPPKKKATVVVEVPRASTPIETPAKRGRGRPPKKKKTTLAIEGPQASTPFKRSSSRILAKNTTDNEPEPEWEVEKVLDSGIDRPTGVHLYLVKWKGFSIKESTWEPRKNLANCLKLIQEYEKEH